MKRPKGEKRGKERIPMATRGIERSATETPSPNTTNAAGWMKAQCQWEGGEAARRRGSEGDRMGLPPFQPLALRLVIVFNRTVPPEGFVHERHSGRCRRGEGWGGFVATALLVDRLRPRRGGRGRLALGLVGPRALLSFRSSCWGGRQRKECVKEVGLWMGMGSDAENRAAERDGLGAAMDLVGG